MNPVSAIEARQQRALTAGIKNIGILGIGGDVAALAATNVVDPVARGRTAPWFRSRFARTQCCCPAARRKPGKEIRDVVAT